MTTADQDKTLDGLSGKHGDLSVVVDSASGDAHAQTADNARAWRIAPDGRAVSTLTRSTRCYCEASYCDHGEGACVREADARYEVDYIGQACRTCIATMRENGGGEYVHELPTDEAVS